MLLSSLAGESALRNARGVRFDLVLIFVLIFVLTYVGGGVCPLATGLRADGA
jgi:hypothetical protein